MIGQAKGVAWFHDVKYDDDAEADATRPLAQLQGNARGWMASEGHEKLPVEGEGRGVRTLARGRERLKRKKEKEILES